MAHCDVCVLARMVPLTDLDHRVDAFFSAQSIRLIDGLNCCIALVDRWSSLANRSATCCAVPFSSHDLGTSLLLSLPQQRAIPIHRRLSAVVTDNGLKPYSFTKDLIDGGLIQSMTQ